MGNCDECRSSRSGQGEGRKEEGRRTPGDLVHFINSDLWYRFIIESIKEDIESSVGIIYNLLDWGLFISSFSPSDSFDMTL